MECEAILKKTNKICSRPAKYTSRDGKCYCGYHYHYVSEPQDKTEKTKIISPENEKAKNILMMGASLCVRTLQKFTYLIILILIMCIVHAYAKAYYYHNCDSNLLKAWLFKKSATCVVLAQIIFNVESWSLKYVSTITHHVTVAVSEMPGLMHTMI